MSIIESLVFSGKSIVGPSSVVVGAVTYPQTTLQATGTTTLLGNVFVQGGALYPPGPLTAASTALSGYAYGNGTYVVSAPEQSSSSAFQVWYAFDNSLTTSTESAAVYSTSSLYAYSNTTPYAFSNTIDVPTTTTYNGVWLQIQMPSAIVLEYYTIFPRAGQETGRSPATWRIFGSNDGTNWYTIDAQSGITAWTAPQVSKTFYLSPLPIAYLYFRLSVQNLNGNNGSGILDVAQWNLYTKPPVPAMTIYGGDLSIVSGGGLQVAGNIYAANAVTTTNVFAATETLTGTTGQTTLNVTGNLYVSNAITTTNITCAGFTSNISNTIFNYDTLTIPFVSCTTLNVASTANVLTLSIPGSTGQTTLNVTGNVYASNAVTTTNVFAATQTLTGTTGRTTSNITGNLYVSNALTITNVFANTVSTTNPIPFRNRLINGAMNIWQRNTAAISTTTSVYTTADRWCGALGTTNLTLTQFAGPTEAFQFANALQIATTTIASGTPLIEQRIENQNITDFLNGTPVSVSFWAGQTVGTLMPLTVGLYYATVVSNFGTQTLAVSATQNTPTLTTANAYYSLSFTLTTSLGSTNGLSLRFTTGGATSAGSTFILTGVQVEKGAFATPFEVRPYSTELALAQRYYYQLTSPTAAAQGSAAVYAIFGTATGITTTAFWLPIQFPVPMRTPNYTLSNSAVTNFQLLPTGTTTITSVGFQTDSFTPVGATLNFVGTNIVPTASYIFRTNNLTGSTTAFFGFSCEL
jgi:hypothetical protein